MPNEVFIEYWLEKHGQLLTTSHLSFYGGCGIGIEITEKDAHDFLSMQINRPLNVHEEGESFLDYTAKELAIRITFELEEKEGWLLFKGLQEPLASRVFHYLTKLRSVD